MVKYFKLKKICELYIENDTIDHNGKNVAYVQKQRYTTYDKIMKAKFTSEL